MAALTRSAMVN